MTWCQNWLATHEKQCKLNRKKSSVRLELYVGPVSTLNCLFYGEKAESRQGIYLESNTLTSNTMNNNPVRLTTPIGQKA